MDSIGDDSIETLVHFARLLAEAPDASSILPRLAGAVVEQAGAQGAAVFQVMESGQLHLAASANLPEGACPRELTVESLGSDLGAQLVRSCGGQFVRSQALPLVSGASLYGVLVMLYAKGEDGLGPSQGRLAGALVDLAAVALDQAHRRAELRRSFERMRAQDEFLARTERLRALGQMATGIAHDLRNIFNPLRLQLGLLRRRKDNPAAVDESAAAAERAIGLGVEMVERLRLFGHQSREEEAREADLTALVDEALGLYGPRRPTELELVVEHEGRPHVRVCAAELVSSVVNLLVNAEEAMGGRGRITVRTGERDGRGWLTVSDTGPGIPREVQERMFEPFFTTKGERGTGLGLSMLRAFVQRSGGTVEVDSAPGRGTTFRLSFPLEGTAAQGPT